MDKLFNQIKCYFDLIIFTLVVLLCESILRYCVGFPLIQLKALFINLLILLMINSILFLFKRNLRIAIESILIVIIFVYSFAQSYHYAFFETFFSFTKLSILNELDGVKNEIFVKFEPKYLLFLLALVTWFIFLSLFKKKVELCGNKKYLKIQMLISLSLIVISLFIYSSIFKITETNQEILIQSEEYLYKTISNKNRFINRFGTLCYLYKDSELVLTQSKTSLSSNDRMAIEKYIENNQIAENEYTSIFEGKNIILVLAESFSPLGYSQELMPTISMMIEDGFYYDNFYAPIYQSSTCDSEFIALTSMIPSIDYGTTSKDFARNDYPYAMANLFKLKGYNANSYHSFIKSFYNREPYHESLGFSHFYDRDDLGLFLEDYHEDYINWIDDGDLFIEMLKHTNLDEPFFNFVISSSGHLPYMDLREELYENHDMVMSVINNIDTDSAYYFASQMKLDQGLKEMIELLDESNCLKDTVIVVFGDHYPYGISNELSVDYFFSKFNEENEFQKYKVPFLIYDGNNYYDSQKQGVTIDKLGSTFDIYPTIVNLFGLNDLTNDAFVVGKDLNSNDENCVIFMDGSILTDDYYFDASMQEIKEISEKPASNLKSTIVKVNDILRYSQIMLVTNYYH